MREAAGAERWSVVCSSWERFIPTLEDDSVDLLVTSPPYEKAREYGEVKFNLAGEAWVEWMVAFVRAASPKVKGLIAINCEGQTKDYRYSAVPFLLTADLHRAGFNLRKPAAYRRNGIPGSGGDDWLRNDWEPVICITRPGRLPWSDNTACGAPPKWAPGGAFSYRGVDGERRGSPGRVRTKKRADGVPRREVYIPPDLCNPGNVVACTVGGSRLGHPLAHENEAPFSIELPEFFIRSFCPPGGLVFDPFVGSGTTIDAAVQAGRRAVGCDIRESMVNLVRRRMATVTPALAGL